MSGGDTGMHCCRCAAMEGYARNLDSGAANEPIECHEPQELCTACAEQAAQFRDIVRRLVDNPEAMGRLCAGECLG